MTKKILAALLAASVLTMAPVVAGIYTSPGGTLIPAVSAEDGAEEAPQPGIDVTRQEPLTITPDTESSEQNEEGWAWDAESMTLTLDGFYLQADTPDGNSPLSFEGFSADDTITVAVEGESVVERSNAPSAETEEQVLEQFLINCGEANLKITGEGRLYIFGPETFVMTGIAAETVELDGGDVYTNVCFCTAQEDVRINGDLQVDSTNYDNSYSIQSYAGPVEILGGNVNLHSGYRGIYLWNEGAEGPVTISGGTVNIAANFANAINSNGRNATVNILGGDVTLSGYIAVVAKEVNVNTAGRLEINGEEAPVLLTQEDGVVNISENAGGELVFTAGGEPVEVPGVHEDDLTAAGWYETDEGYLYYGQNGQPMTGWLQDGNVWYYLDPQTGLMVDNSFYTVDGETYYFYDWGGMASSQWHQAEDGYWYFFNGSGAMVCSEWLEWKGEWYYLTENGRMAADTDIGGYYVNADGVWIQ